MIDEIKKRLDLYRKEFKIQDLKVVMKSEIFSQLSTGLNIELTPDNATIFGYPVEIYDDIIVDWYVTEIIKEDY